MSLCRKTFMLIAVVLLWCCNGKDTLLDLYPMEPIVNPDVGMLIGGDGIIHVDIDGRQRISGIAERGVFSTADRFQSFDFEPRAWQIADGFVAFGDGIIVYAQSVGVSFALRYSMDNGKTWTTYGEAIVDGRFIAAGTVSPVQLLVAADRSVWVLCQQEVGVERRVLLYRIDVEQQGSTLMVEKAGAVALTFGFADSEHGWLLYGLQGESASRGYVLRTANGGHTWTDGAMLDVAGQLAIAPITAEGLLVYNDEGSAFHSADGGISFEPVTVGGGIFACQAVSADVVYALLESGVAKSADGGRTWVTLDAFVHGVEVSGTALDFHDERTGIVYGADRLFITTDGGQSWDVLVYPYDYVLD